jgi:hypothetical protein
MAPENIGNVAMSYTVRDLQLPDPGDLRREYLTDMAMNNIRRFSKTRKTKAIVLAWVNQNYPEEIGDEFALGIPMKILELILAELRCLPSKGVNGPGINGTGTGFAK